MIETSNARIDLAEVEQRIEEELGRARDAGLGIRPNSADFDEARDVADEVMGILEEAERRSRIRTSFPPKLDGTLWRFAKPIVRGILRVHALVFRDQRAINGYLIQALETSTQQSRNLQTEVKQLRESLARMQSGPPDTLAETQRFEFSLRGRLCGSRAEVKRSFDPYAPVFAELALTGEDLVLDLASGRGEWLEWLRDRGIRGLGIEPNAFAAEESRRCGIEVRCQGILDALAERADETLSFVTGFGLLENLNFDAQWELIGQIARVLRPGGAVLLETFDPEHEMVGASSFYTEPERLRPVPKFLLTHLLESKSFELVRVLQFSSCDAKKPGALPRYSVLARGARRP